MIMHVRIRACTHKQTHVCAHRINTHTHSLLHIHTRKRNSHTQIYSSSIKNINWNKNQCRREKHGLNENSPAKDEIETVKS